MKTLSPYMFERSQIERLLESINAKVGTIEEIMVESDELTWTEWDEDG